MRWFRHESRAHRDAKLRKVLMRYGFEGYGLYWYCIENICSGLEPDLTFELEHDSEILAHEGKMDSRKAEEVMRYMVELGLFESSEGVISCLKLARFLGESGTRNIDLKRIIKDAKAENATDCLRLSQTVSDNIRLSQIVSLTEDNIREDNKNTRRFAPPSREEVEDQIKAMGYSHCVADDFINFYGSKNWMVGKNKMSDWRKALGGWESRKKSDDRSDSRQPRSFAI